MECTKGSVGAVNWTVTIAPACPHPRDWIMRQTIRKEGAGGIGVTDGGVLGEGTHQAILSDFPLWSVLERSSCPLQQYNFIQGLLIKYFQVGRVRGRKTPGAGALFFFWVKAGNVSSCLVIITDQLLIKIKWSFLNFNIVLQIMQKTQLIALLAEITFKNSCTQRAKII